MIRNRWLIVEIISFILSSKYLTLHWNEPVTVGTGLISLLWVELVYLIYLNLKERNL